MNKQSLSRRLAINRFNQLWGRAVSAAGFDHNTAKQQSDSREHMEPELISGLRGDESSQGATTVTEAEKDGDEQYAAEDPEATRNMEIVRHLLKDHGETTADHLLLDLQAFRIQAEGVWKQWRQTLLGAILQHDGNEMIEHARLNLCQHRHRVQVFQEYEIRIFNLWKAGHIKLKEETLALYQECHNVMKNRHHQELKRNLDEIRKELHEIAYYLKKNWDGELPGTLQPTTMFDLSAANTPILKGKERACGIPSQPVNTIGGPILTIIRRD